MESQEEDAAAAGDRPHAQGHQGEEGQDAARVEDPEQGQRAEDRGRREQHQGRADRKEVAAPAAAPAEAADSNCRKADAAMSDTDRNHKVEEEDQKRDGDGEERRRDSLDDQDDDVNMNPAEDEDEARTSSSPFMSASSSPDGGGSDFSARRGSSRRRPRSTSPEQEEEGGQQEEGDEVDGVVTGEEVAAASTSNGAGGGLRRRKIRRHVSSSSSSSSSSSDDDESSVERFWREEMADDEEEEEGESTSPATRSRRRRAAAEEEEGDAGRPRPAVLDKPMPKCKASPVGEFVRRETNGDRCPPWRYKQHFFYEHMKSLALTQRLELAHKLQGHKGCVNALHFNETGSLLASGSDDLDIIVWDWAHRKQRVCFDSGHKGNVFQSKFLPLRGDTHIVSTSRDGQVRLAELDSGGQHRGGRRLAVHRGPANRLALLADSPHCFLSGGEDGVVFQLDVRENKPTKLLVQRDDPEDEEGDSTGNKVAIYSIDASPVAGGNLFATSGRDKYVRFFDRRKAGGAEDSRPLKKFCPHHLIDSGNHGYTHVTSVVFSRDGSEVVASYNDEDIYLFKTDHSDGADYRKHFQGHRNSATVKGVNFYGPNSEYVVSGSDCGHVFLWSKDTEAIVNMFHADDSGVVNVLAPHPNLPFMATSGLDDEVKVWYPTAKDEVDRKDIEKTVIRNLGDQRRGRDLAAHDGMDGEMLWMLWRSIRRSEERRRRREEEGEGNAEGGRRRRPDLDSDDSDEDDDDEEEDGPRAGGIQCPTS